MDWENSYDSEGFDLACDLYDNSGLNPYKGPVTTAKNYDVYVSALSRTRATAIQMFGEEVEEKLVETPLLNEVPKRSYTDSKSKKPRFWWVMRSRIQWYLNNARQYETRAMTQKRAEEIADLVEKEGRDCILVTHEFFLYTLKGELEKRGYLVERSDMFRIKNWEKIRATKRDMHCGGCGNNCLLTKPGCGVGRDAAARAGIKTTN